MKMPGFARYSKSISYLHLVVLSGNLLALTGDSAISWSSPMLSKLQSNDSNINPLEYPITEDESSWIGSINSLGSIAGLLPSSILPNIIGRKPTLLMIGLPHILAFILLAFAKTVSHIYIARFLNGFSICSCYIVLPMYIAEISENGNRGLMLVSFAIFSNFGALITYVLGPYLPYFYFNLILAFFPFLFVVTFLLLAPESPYYFVLKKDEVNATKAITLLRSTNYYSNSELELKYIQSEIENSRSGNVLNTFIKKHALKGAAIAMMLTSFQQLSGYAVIMPYTQNIFEKAGTKLPAEICSIIVGAVAFFASFLSPFIIEKKGRKFLLLISIIGIIVSEFIFGLYYMFAQRYSSLQAFNFIPLICLMGYMLLYTIGLGPLPLTITSEILPANIKFVVSTISGFLGSAASFGFSKSYPWLLTTLTMGGMFWLCAGICLILLIFVIFVVPETKGKSFAEIFEILSR